MKRISILYSFRSFFTKEKKNGNKNQTEGSVSMTLIFLLIFSSIAKLKERKRKKDYAMTVRYRKLLRRVYAIMEGEDTTTNVPQFAKQIRKLYAEKQITAVHYHELMKYLSAHYYAQRLARRRGAR